MISKDCAYGNIHRFLNIGGDGIRAGHEAKNNSGLSWSLRVRLREMQKYIICRGRFSGV